MTPPLPRPPRLPAPRALARQAAAVLAALALWANHAARAQTSATGLPPDTPTPQEVGDIVARLASQPEPEAPGYAAMAEATLALGEARLGAGRPLERRVVEDGLDAVEKGRSLDAEVADWPTLRQRLEALLEATPPPPQSGGGQGQSDKGQNPEDAGEKGEAGQDGDAPGQTPPPGQDEEEASPGQPNEGEDPGEAGRQDPSPSPMREIGGQPEAQASNSTREAVLRKLLEQIERQDQPAKLFQLLQQGEETEEETDASARGQDW